MSSSLFGLWALSSMEAAAGRLAFLSGVIRARPPAARFPPSFCASRTSPCNKAAPPPHAAATTDCTGEVKSVLSWGRPCAPGRAPKAGRCLILPGEQSSRTSLNTSRGRRGRRHRGPAPRSAPRRPGCEACCNVILTLPTTPPALFRRPEVCLSILKQYSRNVISKR